METILSSFTRWILVLALMLAYWPFGRHAHATDFQNSANRTPAMVRMENAIYSARFDWKGSSYHFVMGTRPYAEGEANRSRFIAQISLDGELKATCERKTSAGTPFDTNSMLLRCEGPMFGSSAATAKFVFGPTLAEPHLTIWSSPRAMPKLVSLRTDTSKMQVAKSE